MVRRDAVLVGDLRGGDVARRIARELDHAVERQQGVLLQLHRVLRSARRRSGPKIHLQRNERPGHHALAPEEREDQRVVAREQRAHLAHARAPEACADRLQQPRADARQPSVGLTSMANTQPQGGEPNSQSRTSPITKPTTRPPASATRNCRPACPASAVPPVNGSPVAPLFQPGHRRVDGDDPLEVAPPHGADRRATAEPRASRRCRRVGRSSCFPCDVRVMAPGERMMQIKSIPAFRYQNTGLSAEIQSAFRRRRGARRRESARTGHGCGVDVQSHTGGADEGNAGRRRRPRRPSSPSTASARSTSWARRRASTRRRCWCATSRSPAASCCSRTSIPARIRSARGSSSTISPPTLMGMPVEIKVTVAEVKGRAVTFEVERPRQRRADLPRQAPALRRRREEDRGAARRRRRDKAGVA